MSEPFDVTVGVRAPLFVLPSVNGQSVSLDAFADKRNVVLYFYPKDETPGCTVEACAFRDAFADFENLDTVILGVSTDDVASHVAFAKRHKLQFPLLADVDASVCKAYGVYVERVLYGERTWGIERTTFLIDKRGLIRHIWRRVKVEKHAREILELVRKELA